MTNELIYMINKHALVYVFSLVIYIDVPNRIYDLNNIA